MTPSESKLSGADLALCDLLGLLAARDYHFVAPTPATQAIVLGRQDGRRACDLREVFGWGLPFDPDLLDMDLYAAADQGGVLVRTAEGLRSAMRVSRVHGCLFLHSAYPTVAADSVFLGPDTYRFADFIAAELEGRPAPARIVDIGTGAGVGGILAGLRHPAQVALSDVNPQALRLARVNARHAGVSVAILHGDGLAAVRGPFDLALANPPYLVDAAERAYRHGGDMHGAQLSLDWALEAARRLEPQGRLLLYTGSAIVGGRDRLREALTEHLPARGCSLRYREIDPDIFGEELAEPAYADVERIAAVGAVVTRDLA